MKWAWRASEQLVDWLPWWLPLDPTRREVILTSSGGLLRVARLDPPDFETSSPEALVAHHGRISEALARFGNGWSIWIDQWRSRTYGYLDECDFGGCHAAQLVDASRRRFFTGINKPVFANTVFLAIHYLPQSRDALLGWMMDKTGPQFQANIDFFIENSNSLIGQLRHSFSGIDILHGDPLASYLAASVTYQPKPTRFPSGVIARGLATREWHLGDRVRIDERHLSTVEVRNFGSPSPMTVEALHELPFECRWVASFHGLGPEERRKELLEVRKRWLTKQKGLASIITEIVTKNPFAGRTDPEADRSIAALDLMQGELAYRPFALATCNIHVWGSTGEEADERAATVVSLLNAVGLEARQATLNNVFALLADMPGAVGKEVANLRRSREEIPAITRLSPVTGVSSGSRTDWRFGGSALCVGLTRRGVPFSWAMNSNQSGVAHTGIIGKTRSGKSILLSFMASQFLRYADAKVILFDRRRSFMVACLALGGDWIELGGGGHGVQPLRAIHLPEEMAWAQSWILSALQVQGMKLQPHTDGAISEALSHVADRPPDERTLSMLHTYLAGDEQARQALKSYRAGGPYGDLFDGVVASYGDRSIVGIETQDIIDLKQVAPLVVSAVFRAVRRDRLGGDAPKLVIIDEAWSMMENDLFVGQIISAAREFAKLNAALVLATQDISDLMNERTKVIFSQLGNKIYLPHAEAMRTQSREMYEAAGLLEEQIRVLATAQPKSEYLLQTEEVTRLLSLRLEDDALALCGASSPLDHSRAFFLLQQGVQPGAEFTQAWLAETTREWRDRNNLAELERAA